MRASDTSKPSNAATTFVPRLARRLAKESKKRLGPLNDWGHLVTAQMRVMPDFIIIGAQKCGTSSLGDYLEQHPFVAFSRAKEVHFFDANFKNGTHWYRAQFPTSLYKRYVKRFQGQNLVAGEKSPYYVFYPLAPRRIAATLPHVKLILMLRNPVDRAYSHYNHQVRKGRETLSFEEAIEKEPERLSGELDKILADEHYTSFNHVHFSYLSRGIYIDQLIAWRQYFPQEQFLILSSEDFFADPSVACQEVLEFLNLPGWALKRYGKSNVGRYSRMQETTRKKLIEYFAPHNQRLYEYLGTSFDWDR